MSFANIMPAGNSHYSSIAHALGPDPEFTSQNRHPLTDASAPAPIPSPTSVEYQDTMPHTVQDDSFADFSAEDPYQLDLYLPENSLTDNTQMSGEVEIAPPTSLPPLPSIDNAPLQLSLDAYTQSRPTDAPQYALETLPYISTTNASSYTYQEHEQAGYIPDYTDPQEAIRPSWQPEWTTYVGDSDTYPVAQSPLPPKYMENDFQEVLYFDDTRLIVTGGVPIENPILGTGEAFTSGTGLELYSAVPAAESRGSKASHRHNPYQQIFKPENANPRTDETPSSSRAPPPVASTSIATQRIQYPPHPTRATPANPAKKIKKPRIPLTDEQRKERRRGTIGARSSSV